MNLPIFDLGSYFTDSFVWLLFTLSMEYKTSISTLVVHQSSSLINLRRKCIHPYTKTGGNSDSNKGHHEQNTEIVFHLSEFILLLTCSVAMCHAHAFTCFAATARRMRKTEHNAHTHTHKNYLRQCESCVCANSTSSQIIFVVVVIETKHTVCAMRWCFFISENICTQNRITRTVRMKKETGKEFTLFKRFLENAYEKQTHTHTQWTRIKWDEERNAREHQRIRHTRWKGTKRIYVLKIHSNGSST